MSTSFSGSIQALVLKAYASIGRDDLDEALQIVHDVVERIITEPLCTAQVFASKELDELCLKIGSQNLSFQKNVQDDPCPQWSSTKRVAYLVTRLQRSGGHSRLVQDFIRSQPEKKHLVILTGVAGPSDLDHYLRMFADADNVSFMVAPRSKLRVRLSWIQNLLRAFKPDHIELFNHHQDAVAVSALVPELGINGNFIHHGDHHLCLGVFYKHLQHIDLHPMGYHYCRHVLDIDNKYLPLTIQDQGNSYSSENKKILNSPITTATVARSNKIEIPYFVNYIDTVPLILKATKGRHIHIGKLTPWALRRMRNQIKEYGLRADQFVYIDWTENVWKSLQELQVDAYLASFPYGAGLTLIEAMGASVPVIMHEHMYSRVLSGLELAYPDAFSWSDPRELFIYLETLTPLKLQKEGIVARKHYENNHRSEILKEFLNSYENFSLEAPPLNLKYKPKMDEWAAWAESQLEINRVLYRFTYRSWRRLRRILS
jgi:hypothetical protein